MAEFKARDGSKMPMLAFGAGTAWFKDPESKEFDKALVQMVKDAISAGYRHIDCAEMYGNEKEVGVAIQESGIARDELYITTKVADGIHDIPNALTQSLEKLQMSYVDSYLIHNPFFAKSDQDLQEAWKAMEKEKKNGRTKSIGVSNYLRKDMEATFKTAVDPPAVNQIEFHPYLQRAGDYVPWMQSKGIQVEAFKGLAPISQVSDGPLVPIIQRIAKEHNTTDACVLLAWHRSKRVLAVTTTRKKERLHEYLRSLQVNLTDAEVEEITRVGNSHPARTAYKDRFEDGDWS